MLEEHAIIAFLATRDADRARAFYEEVLGLKLLEETPLALIFNARGTMLRVQKARDFVPAPHTVLGWHVPAIKLVVRALIAKGVELERFEGFEQDELGVWQAPDGARVAWFKDPDGNLLSLTQFSGPA